ncbi:MAG: hypothetical protein IJL76_03815 [Bacilli bacterium]|nr:hypothetical protein [Bacilli bacterium]
MELYSERIEDGKYVKRYKNDEVLKLDEIVNNLQSKGVTVNRILVEEDAELDMQNFGEEIITSDEFDKLHRYNTGYDFHYEFDIEYGEKPVGLNVYKSIFRVTSEDPDLQLSDIYEDVKKKEIEAMLNDSSKGVNYSHLQK